MAKISFANLDQQFSFVLDAYTIYTGSTLEEAVPTSWSWVTKLGHDVDFLGTALTYDGGNAPTGGTLTRLALDLNNDNFAGAELLVTELSVSAKDLAALVNGGLTDERQENLFWRVVLAGNDEVDFTQYSGNDTIDFSADGRHVITGETLFGGDDTITGVAGKDAYLSGDYQTVDAGASAYGGDDVIVAAASLIYGDFAVVGGFASGGSDTITVEAGKTYGAVYGDADTVTAGGVLAGGNDTLNLFGTTTRSEPGVGDAYIVAGQLVGGDDTITGGDEGQALLGDTKDVLTTGVLRGGNDVIKGGGGGDSLFGDWIEVKAGGKAIGGNDQLFGETGDDTLFGNGGNDSLDGGADKDALFGGDGNDTLAISAESDFVAGETYDGGLGKDTLLLRFEGFNYALDLAGVTLAGIEALIYSDPGQNGFSTVALNAVQVGGGLSSTATVTGNFFSDVADTLAVSLGAQADVNLSGLILVNLADAKDTLSILGNDSANKITGSSVKDQITGGKGADTLNGGGGADILIGGADNDTYIIDNAGDVADESVAGSTGVDTVRSSVMSVNLGDTAQFKGAIEQAALDGSFALNATGNGLNNYLQGNSAANRFDGGIGADTMRGLGGNDTYVIDNAGDVVDEIAAGSTGVDTVRSSTVSINLFEARFKGTIEQVALDGTLALNAVGSSINNYLQGNGAANGLNGGLGNDTMKGNGGADGFTFSTALNAATNVDTINDFAVDDTIYLTKAIFSGIAATGTLTAAAFASNTTGLAGDATDRIIYETDSGKLFYDADGLGGVAGIQFATLPVGLGLTNADFVVT